MNIRWIIWSATLLPCMLYFAAALIGRLQQNDTNSYQGERSEGSALLIVMFAAIVVVFGIWALVNWIA